MSKFVREGRYIVVKPDHEDDIRTERLRNYIEEMCFRTPECVVVEADWPEYEPVWRMIELRVTGQPVEDFEAQRLRADTAESELKSALYKLGLSRRNRDAAQRRYEEMSLARDCIATNYNQLSYGASICKDKLSEAEQRIASLENLIAEAHVWIDQNCFGGSDAYDLRDRLIAALNYEAKP